MRTLIQSPFVSKAYTKEYWALEYTTFADSLGNAFTITPVIHSNAMNI